MIGFECRLWTNTSDVLFPFAPSEHSETVEINWN